jgi:hypothetical protein
MASRLGWMPGAARAGAGDWVGAEEKVPQSSANFEGRAGVGAEGPQPSSLDLEGVRSSRVQPALGAGVWMTS